MFAICLCSKIKYTVCIIYLHAEIFTAQPKKCPKLFSYMEVKIVPRVFKVSHDGAIYLSHVRLAGDTNPLAYWKLNQTSSPNPVQYVCKYLAIAASIQVLREYLL